MAGVVGNYNHDDVGQAVRTLIANYLSETVETISVGLVDIVNGDGTINVKPLLNKPNVDGTQLEYPVLPDVPILFNENTSLYVKVTKGDIVVLVFCKQSLTNWALNGRTANGLYNQQFALSSAFAIPVISSVGVAGQLQALCTAAFLNHTHAAGTLLVAPSGGGPCTGTTGEPVPAIPGIVYSTQNVKAA